MEDFDNDNKDFEEKTIVSSDASSDDVLFKDTEDDIFHTELSSSDDVWGKEEISDDDNDAAEGEVTSDNDNDVAEGEVTSDNDNDVAEDEVISDDDIDVTEVDNDTEIDDDAEDKVTSDDDEPVSKEKEDFTHNIVYRVGNDSDTLGSYYTDIPINDRMEAKIALQLPITYETTADHTSYNSRNFLQTCNILTDAEGFVVNKGGNRITRNGQPLTIEDVRSRIRAQSANPNYDAPDPASLECTTNLIGDKERFEVCNDEVVTKGSYEMNFSRIDQPKEDFIEIIDSKRLNFIGNDGIRHLRNVEQQLNSDNNDERN